VGARAGASITGVGVVSPAGLGLAPLYEACRRGETLLAKTKHDARPVGRIPMAALDEARQRLADSELAPTIASAHHGTEAEKPLLMTGAALLEALGDSGLRIFDKDTGLIFATTTGHIASWEKDLPRYVRGDLKASAFAASFAHYPLTRAIDGLISQTDFRGAFQVLTSACAAGAQALALASLWLRTGRAKRVVIGATETLTQLTAQGFGCFNLLASDVARPFAADRQGINLSEAAAFFVLDADPDAPGYGRVLGGATTLDAFDMTRPHPEGRGLHTAITRALADAHLSPDAIDWVHAHGTGTPANDSAEAAALQMLFGTRRPPVTSTKAIHGHALGASGLLETALALEAMRRGEILPTAATEAVDPALSLDVRTRLEPARIRTTLKTTLGFGGVNAALVLAQGEAHD
jgi:3-oxoacyl-(acyl-carrier-protein) synthase